MQEYRCTRCHRLLFKGSLRLLLTKQHEPDKDFIEPKCDRCGRLNRFSLDQGQRVEK